jgi:DNA invertase Pin-like site-specific DNA recombinase
LEAQQEAINAFLQPGDRLLSPVFVEVESGRKDQRPQLTAALERCRATGSTLLVAKLDRLSRNARFLLSVVEGSGDGGVVFIDLPNIPPGPVGKFLVTQMAAVAELEAGLISQRTKAALAAAKARGVKLGGDRGYRPETPPDWIAGSVAAAKQRTRKAYQSAMGVLSAIEEACESGATTLAAIAAHLNGRGVTTASGKGEWTATAVRRVLVRVEA